MKEALLTVLRDKTTSTVLFRKTADQLALILAAEAASFLPLTQKSVDTPFGVFSGKQLVSEILLVPILRAGIALLPPFLQLFPEAYIATIGASRDEKTAESHIYYANLPKMGKDRIALILDPMLATGGTACNATRLLLEQGASEENIFILGIISAAPGRELVAKTFPKTKIHYMAEDPILNEAKYIVPGLGDFGDRYFKS